MWLHSPAPTSCVSPLHHPCLLQVLLQSLFTLVPIGHSPECYRLYEALEAGSIPVVVDNPYTRKERCGDPWLEFRDSGLLVILKSWEVRCTSGLVGSRGGGGGAHTHRGLPLSSCSCACVRACVCVCTCPFSRHYPQTTILSPC